MPHDRLNGHLDATVDALVATGTAKGDEAVVVEVLPPSGRRGPRVRLRGEGDRLFIRLNSNSYLGMGLRPAVVAAEEEASRAYGAGPGAVRFISGTYAPHVALEERLAAFHHREAAMVFSSAYATVVSAIVPLATSGTVLVSDELNHNSIISAMRLARPLEKVVYPHLDVGALDDALERVRGEAKRVLVVTDGVFSMRGDHAPLDEILRVARAHDPHFEENVLVVVDDSHGVGAFGPTGRGTEEHTGAPPADILIGTLGKAFGVNGGYVVSSRSVVRFLRESAPMYVYSNPITPGEAAAALASLEIVDSAEGERLLARLRRLTGHFQRGLSRLGLETIPGNHPIVPLMIRDTARTRALVEHLRRNGVLATGLAYPVVPKGDDEIRVQITADHTEADLDHVLDILCDFDP